MKKVVVVVGLKSVSGESDVPIKEFFEGKDLKVNDPSQALNFQNPCLTILDGDKELAAFKKWVYWRKLED